MLRGATADDGGVETVPAWSTIGVFVAAAAILVVIPGPNTIYIATRSLESGPRAGIVSALGVMTGTLFHVVAAALGLSALMLTSAVAFDLVKYVGAAYLIFLGVRALLSREAAPDSRTSEASGDMRATFRQGVAVNLLNPKTVLFIAAFLPQFVDVARGPAAPQILVLGLALAIVGGVSDLTYALLAGRFGGLLRNTPLVGRARRYVAGSVYLVLGAAAALSGARST
jgi:threonine/homoserine/homoserine lactone efflux protein